MASDATQGHGLRPRTRRRDVPADTDKWVRVEPEDVDNHSAIHLKKVEIHGEVNFIMLADSSFDQLDVEKIICMEVAQFRRLTKLMEDET